MTMLLPPQPSQLHVVIDVVHLLSDSVADPDHKNLPCQIKIIQPNQRRFVGGEVPLGFLRVLGPLVSAFVQIPTAFAVASLKYKKWVPVNTRTKKPRFLVHVLELKWLSLIPVASRSLSSLTTGEVSPKIKLLAHQNTECSTDIPLPSLPSSIRLLTSGRLLGFSLCRTCADPVKLG